MPALIELSLKATWTVRPDTRQLHGLACALFEDDDADHLGPEKPFAVWPLRPASAGSGHDWELRAGWLRPGAPPAGVISPERLRLGHTTCQVTQAAHRVMSHGQLAATGACRLARMVFHSPVFFSQNGTDVMVPDPRLIAGSWRRRWNSSLPEGDALKIGDEEWKEVHRSLHLAGFDLRTGRRDSGRGRDRTGFTGWAELRVEKGATPEAQAVFGTLARFAEFCGTGAQTTHGFGATSVDVESAGRDG